MKKIAMIPARLDSTRLPKKMLLDLAGKPVIVRTFEAVSATGLFDSVVVVTDSLEIKAAVEKAGGKTFLSQKTHESGTDRIAEAAENLDADVVLNVQGDEPFVNKSDLEQILALFEDPTTQVASVMKKMENQADIDSPNFVKVVVDKYNNALMFSRSVLPYLRDTSVKVNYYEHRGLYAFTKSALLNFTNLDMTPLEAAEKVECLRFLENGIGMKMIETNFAGVEIDTEADLIEANRIFMNN